MLVAGCGVDGGYQGGGDHRSEADEKHSCCVEVVDGIVLTMKAFFAEVCPEGAIVQLIATISCISPQ